MKDLNLVAVVSLVLLLLSASIHGQRRVSSANTDLIAYMKRNGDVTSEQLREGAKLDIRQVDLNRDGLPEYFVEGSGSSMCGRRCSVWVYRKTETGFQRIFNEMQQVEIGRQYHNGWRELLVAGPMGPYEMVSEKHRFSNGEYRGDQSTCYVTDVRSNRTTKCDF